MKAQNARYCALAAILARGAGRWKKCWQEISKRGPWLRFRPQEGLYISTDTPFEKNHVYRLDQAGNVEQVGDLSSSSIFGCRVSGGVGEAMFFSTMIEPSAINTGREVHLAGSRDGTNWQVLARWTKDSLPMRYFQYGNAFLPDGENLTPYLAATAIAVKADDLVTTLWEVEPA